MSRQIFKGRVLPTKFTGVISTDWHRTFTLKERLKILLGYNFSVAIRIVTVNSPGKFNPIIVGETTKHTSPSEMVKERLQNVLAEQNAANIVQ